MGRSLLAVDGGALDERLAALPGVRSFTYDRAFPHTLRVVVRPERPVLVLRQGVDAYLVAASGRVLRPLAHPHLSQPAARLRDEGREDRRRRDALAPAWRPPRRPLAVVRGAQLCRAASTSSDVGPRS